MDMKYIGIDVDTEIDVPVHSILRQIDTEDLQNELDNRKISSLSGYESVRMIKNTIDTELSTESVKEIYDHISASYHYDIFKKMD